MVEVTTNRGTSKTEVDDESGSNWAGKKFKKYQKERLDEAGDAKLAKDRGTGTVSADDIPETESSDAKKVTSKRGTDTQDL
ncbi:uncharacterized protein METZ01_LOCUS133233 [marine metagenome]|uniref:Uncharacterized protein n=1 Tax=marine metagenome TaxID=408172 RepID=A0A381YTT3_9ZZZZ|tara:strand:- start:160 stop:402 length:243 start_codon:yes stop_codon:yes gene_type:complete